MPSRRLTVPLKAGSATAPVLKDGVSPSGLVFAEPALRQHRLRFCAHIPQ